MKKKINPASLANLALGKPIKKGEQRAKKDNPKKSRLAVRMHDEDRNKIDAIKAREGLKGDYEVLIWLLRNE